MKKMKRRYLRRWPYLTEVLGPVVQSIIGLTSSLRGQVFYDFITKSTDIFVEKMREVFALQKLLTFFKQNIGKF